MGTSGTASGASVAVAQTSTAATPSVPRQQTSRNPPLTSRLALAYYVLSFNYFVLCWIAAIALCTWFPLLWPALVAYTAFLYGPGAKPSYTGTWPTPLRSWGMWRAAARYFPAALHKTAELPPGRPYLFAYHPHGILSFGAWLSFGTNALGFPTKFPGVDIRLLTLNINFRAPALREYLLLHGIASVSRHACINMLSHGKSICIAVGGGSESLLARPGEYTLILNRRHGFVKIALRTGAALVPVIAFGEQEVYRTINELPHSSRLRRLQRRLEKATGFTLPLAYGRGVFAPWGLLPYPHPIDVVVGAPIHVEKYTGDAGSAEFHALVDKLHARYVAALTALFEEHKEKYAKGAGQLKIVE